MLTQGGLKVSMGLPLLWGLESGSACFVWLGSFLGLASEPVSLIFQTLSIIYQRFLIMSNMTKLSLCHLTLPKRNTYFGSLILKYILIK